MRKKRKARHPWILFYTGRTLKTLSIKSESNNQVGVTSAPPASATMLESHRNKTGCGPLGDDTNWHLSFDSLSCKSEEQDDSGFVDALAVAISHVKISEPKRSRRCAPTSPIE